MIERLTILKDIETELSRFKSKLDAAIKEEKANANTYNRSPKFYAAAKRSAMDLKQALTVLTKDERYK